MFSVYQNQYCSLQSLVPNSENNTLADNFLYSLSWKGLTPLSRMPVCLYRVDSQDCVLFLGFFFY